MQNNKYIYFLFINLDDRIFTNLSKVTNLKNVTKKHQGRL